VRGTEWNMGEEGKRRGSGVVEKGGKKGIRGAGR